MFDVSDLNYVFTNGCFDISIYLFFAKLLNFIMLFTWTTFKILVVNTDSTPYFFVWVLGFLVWFFLEISSEMAQYFNAKHSTLFKVIKQYEIIVSHIKLYYNSYYNNTIKKLIYQNLL